VRKIEIDGKSVTVGLDWDALKGNGSVAKETRDLIKNNEGVKKGIIIKANGLTVIGMIPPGEKLKAPSAAAWLSDANRKFNIAEGKKRDDFEEENWIVVEQVSNEEYWMAVIKDGVPLPGLDVVDTFEETLSKIDNLVSIGDFVVHTPDDMIRNYFAQQRSTNNGFTSLIANTKYKKSVSQLSGVDPKILLAVLGTVIILGGYFAYDTWSTEREQAEALRLQNENQQKASQDSQKAQITYEDQKREAVQQAFKQAEGSLNKLLSQPASPALMTSWSDLISQVKLSHDGWDITTIQCEVDGNTPFCTVNLARGELGINRTLMQDFPTAVINGDTASYVLRGDELPAQTGDYKALNSGDDFKVNVLSDLQILKFGEVKHQVDGSTEVNQNIKLPEPPTGIQQEMNVSPIRMGIAVGAIHIQGKDIWQLKDAGAVLETKAITLQKIVITVPKEFNGSEWKLEGIYYIKLGEPVMPTIPPSKRLGT